MAITTVQSGSRKLIAVVIKKHCLGPGGEPLEKGRKVRIPEADAYTLIAGEQAEKIPDVELAKAEK